MQPKPKAIILDLDGTLLNSLKRISGRIIKNAHG
jgi:hydroxymethylpyrimidine pyrophosphatase-like HAD family hydrolase